MSRTLDRDDEARSAADRCIAEFLDRGYSSYLTLVRAAQARPANRAGSDKSWVERAMREYQRHYRDARRSESWIAAPGWFRLSIERAFGWS